MSVNQKAWCKLTNGLLKFAVGHCVPGDRLFACYWWTNESGIILRLWWRLSEENDFVDSDYGDSEDACEDIRVAREARFIGFKTFFESSGQARLIVSRLYAGFLVAYVSLSTQPAEDWSTLSIY